MGSSFPGRSDHAMAQRHSIGGLAPAFGPMTFIGGSDDTPRLGLSSVPRQSPADRSVEGSASGSLPLSMTSVGDRVWIVHIKGGHQMVRRLTDMGIVQGTEVRIISRTDSGSVVVAFNDCRIGLGAGMSHRVLVTTTPQETAAPRSFSSASVTQSLSPSSTGEESMPTPTVLHLGALDVGQSGRITGYEKGNRAYREKLLAMGLTPGTQFVVTRQAPMGDPIEVEVRGFKLSLRKNEAAMLMVEPATNQPEEANHE